MSSDDIEERLAALETEHREMQQRLDELKELVEIRGEAKIKNIWIDDLPIGALLHTKRQQLDDIIDRVIDLEHGAVDPTEVATAAVETEIDDLLPIHEKYIKTQRYGPSHRYDFTENQEIAARLFPYVIREGHSDPNDTTILKIYSTKVKQLIERELSSPELAKRLDVVDPNSNTVKRVMEFLADETGDLVELRTVGEHGGSANRLLIHKQPLQEYQGTVIGDSSDDDMEVAGAGVTTAPTPAGGGD